ncbi:Cytochrome P450 4B1 [Trichoplax sp. H2]|nr:Cytochrome P450 4B1 [Trichoplax sp. H2]|eukprot:RDD37853.1 Cytochrome P450 4B1 [Trichoplax sp. H2]
MNTLVLVLIAIAVAFLLKSAYSFFSRISNVWKALGKVPGPYAHWLTGTYIGTLETFIPAHSKLCEKYQDMFPMFYNVANFQLCISNPILLKQFLKPSISKETIIHSFFEEWVGPGILQANGPQWSRNRRLLTPAFHFDVLKSYMKVFNECADILINKWVDKAKDGKPIEILDDMSLCAFDAIIRCTCSTELNTQTHGSRHQFLIACRENTYLGESRIFNLFHHSSFLYKLSQNGRKFHRNVAYCRQFARDIILRRKAELDGQEDDENKKHYDFLDIMLKAKDSDGTGMSVDEIVHEVITFLFAGHDTTSTSLSWLLFSLACNPQCQRQCQEEIRKVTEDRNDIRWEDLSALSYTTLCVKESQRLHTTVPFIGRTLGEETTVNGYTFPKGMDLELPIYHYHHDSRWWKNPWDFDPSRFTPENSQGRDPFCYLPFAVGTRNCIGQNFALQELKAIAAKILQRFELSTDNPTYQHIPAGVLKNKGGIYLTLKDRK